MRSKLTARVVLVVALALGAACTARTSGERGGEGNGGGQSESPADCATAPLRTTGTVHYYCECAAGSVTGCRAGTDDPENPGTSPDSPRRSLAGALDRFNSMPAGDTVAFCRGGAWTEPGGELTNTACTAAAPCELRDYTPTRLASAPRPIFSVGAGSFLWATRTGTRSGYRIWNLDVRHTGGQGISFNLGSTCEDVDLCNVAMSGGEIGVLEQTTNQRITIRGSSFTNYTQDAILAGSHGLRIDGNTFVDAGAAATNRQHVIYLQGGVEVEGGYDDERVTNNDIRFTRSCAGTVIVNAGRNNDLLVENNRISSAVPVQGGCYGIAAGHGFYPYGAWHNRAIIRRNRILLPGSQLGISASVCVDCQVTDNLVVLDTQYDALQGIVVPELAHREPGQDLLPANGVPDATTTRVQLRNNTVYFPRSLTIVNGYPGVGTRHEGIGAIVEDNAVWTAGAANTCLQLDVPITRSSGNYCRSSGGAAADAVFEDPLQGSFWPAQASPLLGAGSSTYYSATAPSHDWSAADPGVPRTPPIAAGAFVP